MKWLLIAVLIPMTCFGMLRDSAQVAQRKVRLREMQTKSRLVKQHIVGELQSQQQAPPPPPPIEHRPPVHIRYNGSGQHVTKADFNRVVDSLVESFYVSLEDIRSELDHFHKMDDAMLGNDEVHQEHWDTVVTWITGGGAATFLTALAGIIVLLRRKKKNGKAVNG